MVQNGSSMSDPSSLTVLTDVMATRKATFINRWNMEQVAIGSKGGMIHTERMRLRSHCSVGFTTGGESLVRPFRIQLLDE